MRIIIDENLLKDFEIFKNYGFEPNDMKERFFTLDWWTNIPNYPFDIRLNIFVDYDTYKAYWELTDDEDSTLDSDYIDTKNLEPKSEEWFKLILNIKENLIEKYNQLYGRLDNHANFN